MFKKFLFSVLLLIAGFGVALAQTTDSTVAPSPPPVEPVPVLTPAVPAQPTDAARPMEPMPPPPPMPPQRPFVPMDNSSGQRFMPPPPPPQPRFSPERKMEFPQNGGPGDRMMPQDQNQDHEEEDKPRFDPGQIKRDLSDIKRAKAELKRLIFRAKKLPNLSGELQTMSDLSARLDILAQVLSGYESNQDSAEEALEELHDLDLWDKINEFRMKIDLPDRIKRIEKDLNRTEKQLKNKVYQTLGIDISVLQNHLSEARTFLAEAKNKFAAGDLESAMEEMNDIQERLSPGDIGCVANSLREFKQSLARVKDEGIKQNFQEVIDPLMESVGKGEYRGACQGFNGVRNELFKVMRYYGNGRKNQGLNDQSRQKLEQLQQKIEEKIKSNPNNEQEIKPNRGAYLLEIIRDWFWY